MTQLAIAIDFGSSGFLAQAIDLSSGEIISTTISTRHPLPGVNVIDHIHFSLEVRIDTTNRIVIDAVNRIAAGSALEGQHISCVVLAVPGAISDILQKNGLYRERVLDSEMLVRQGPLVNLRDGRIYSEGDIRPVGITGTGTVAILYHGLRDALVSIPTITTEDCKLNFGCGIECTEEDLVAAGKAPIMR